VQALLIWTESRKIFTFRINQWKIIYLPLIFMAVVIACQLFTNKENLLWFAAAQLLLSITLVWVTYRNELMGLFQKR
jgi:hypothetical protein